MGTKHTPGPWKHYRNQHGHTHVVADHFMIFIGTHVGAPGEVWDANARLIAAAPELLEALSGIVEWMEQHHPEAAANIPQARDAIKKATA